MSKVGAERSIRDNGGIISGMITSMKAIEKLKEEMMSRFAKAGLGFRVYRDPNVEGEARLALKLDTKGPGDETIETQGMRLFVEPGYSLKLKNLELDYVDGPEGGFVLKDCRGEYCTNQQKGGKK
jgi:Fe-S cluster assembly iron-binding protein IscA